MKREISRDTWNGEIRGRQGEKERAKHCSFVVVSVEMLKIYRSLRVTFNAL